MDTDLDIVSTFTTFAGGSTIYPNWYMDKGFSPKQSLGLGILYDANSGGTYTGKSSCGTTVHLWGDYMSTIWDSNSTGEPNAASPNETESFWSVHEYSTGSGNQSTKWIHLADPLPFFVDSSIPNSPKGTFAENECSSGAGSSCALDYTAPTGAQPGDLFIAEIDIGEATYQKYLTLPAGWVLLPNGTNGNGTGRLLSTDGRGTYVTSFTAAYVCGSQANDSGTYKFVAVP